MRKSFMPVGLVTYAVQILGIGENVRARMSESGQKDFNGRWVFATLFYNSKYNHSRRYPSVECQDCPLAINLLTLFFETNLIFYWFLIFYLLLFTHRLIASNRPRVSNRKIIVSAIATLSRHVSHYVSASVHRSVYRQSNKIINFLYISRNRCILFFSTLFLPSHRVRLQFFVWTAVTRVHNSSLARSCT